MISDKQSDALFDFCGEVLDGIIDKDWMKDHITIKTDKLTATVTIEIWDMDEQDFKDFDV
jgi:hypothetical protein